MQAIFTGKRRSFGAPRPWSVNEAPLSKTGEESPRI